MSEHDEQVALFEWAAWQGAPVSLMFAIPNGGKRHISVARRLKAEGVKAGVPDIFLPVAVGQYHGLFIELKTKKGRLSDAQREVRLNLLDGGYCAVVARGVDHAIALVKGYLKGEL